MTQPTFIRGPTRPPKPRVDTELIRLIVSLYAFDETNTQVLAGQLAKQMTIEYGKTIQAQLNKFGCQKLATMDAQAQRWIVAQATKDAKGIATTYNRELGNQVQRMYAANPRGNRNYYYKGLEAWAAKRNKHKLPLIALTTAQTLRRYAKDRFRVENGIKGRYRLVGPAPVCFDCVMRKALGTVDFETTQRYPCPAHPGCPHEWEEVIIKAIDCETAWTG